jgi:hypothetical protein
MLVTYPQTIPHELMSWTDFKIIPVTTSNVLWSGASLGTEVSPAYWKASLESVILTIEEHGEWDAFFDACRGDTQYFLMYDPARKMPRKYRTFNGLVKAGTSTPFTGTAIDVSAITDPRDVTMLGFPASFQLRKGDNIGFVQNGRYSLHRLTVDATASLIGLMRVGFEPPLNTSLFTTSATAEIVRAKGEFILENGSEPDRVRRADLGPISFKAVQRGF